MKRILHIIYSTCMLFIALTLMIGVPVVVFKSLTSDRIRYEIQANDEITMSNNDYCIKYYSDYRVEWLPVKCLSAFK